MNRMTSSPLSRHLAAVVAALAVLFTAGAANAQFRAEAFVYSFIQTRTGNADNFVLVPVGTDVFRLGAPLSATVPPAFGLLRNAKVATYGNTSIIMTDADIQAGRVIVNLDPAAAANFDIIASETVLTFAALGVQQVVFPGFREDGMTVDDVQYAYYRMQLPLWQALAAGPVPACDVIMPDGSRMSAQQVSDGIAANDPSIAAAVFSTLASDSPAVVYNALAVIPGLGLLGFEAAVIPVFEHPDPVIRTAAVTALAASSNSAALDQLVAVMDSDPDMNVRIAAAQALSASPVEAYRLYELFFRAASPDPAVRVPALTEIASIDDPRVNERLVSYASDVDPSFASLSVSSLIARRAWPELVGLLEATTVAPDLKMVAAAGLARADVPETAMVGLTYRLANGDADAARLAVNSMAEQGAAGLEGLVSVLTTNTVIDLQILSARILGERAESSYLDAVASLATDSGVDERLRRASRVAVASILARAPATELAAGLASPNPAIKGATLELAAAAGTPAVADMLEAALADSSPLVRGGAAAALAAFPGEESTARLLDLMNDPDAWVRGKATEALGSMGAENAAAITPLLIGGIESGDPEVVAGGVMALAGLGQVQLRGLVIDKLRFPDAFVRIAALRAAAILADSGDPRDVLSAVAGLLRDENMQVRLEAAQLLGGFASETSVISLANVVNDPSLEMRLEAIRQLGNTGMPSAFSVLMTLLEDPLLAARLAAVEAMRPMASAAFLPDLESILSRAPDAETAAAIHSLITQVQPGG